MLCRRTMMAWRTGVLAAIALAVLFLPGTASAQDNGATYAGSIPIARSQPELVEMAPNIEVFPGQTIELKASGSANVNQLNYEKRRCKYFGLKCWYEKRSRVKIRPHDEFKIVVVLMGPKGEIDRTSITSGQKGELAYDLGEGQFTASAKIYAFISEWKNDAINRANCKNRPRSCSSGSLGLTIVDSRISERRESIKKLLGGYNGNTLDPLRIRSRSFIDPLTINSPARAIAIQTAIGKSVNGWIEQASKNRQNQIVQVIQYALDLSPNGDNRALLNQARLDAYMKLGAYEDLINNAHATIEELKKTCKNGTRCTPEQARRLAQALASLAVAQAEKRARVDLSDITLSVATLGRGIDALEEALDGRIVSEVQGEIRVLSDLYQDSADMLSLIRTPKEIELAVRHMSQAVCLHELGSSVTFQVGKTCPETQGGQTA